MQEKISIKDKIKLYSALYTYNHGNKSCTLLEYSLKIGDLSDVDSKKAQLFFKSAKAYYPARIICRDRMGIKNGAGKPAPMVVLVKHPTEGEILFEATINGEAYSAQQGCHQALYIKYGK